MHALELTRVYFCIWQCAVENCEVMCYVFIILKQFQHVNQEMSNAKLSDVGKNRRHSNCTICCKKNRCALHAAHAIWYFMINVCYDLKKKWKVRETNFQSQFYEKITFSRLSLRCRFIQIWSIPFQRVIWFLTLIALAKKVSLTRKHQLERIQNKHFTLLK